MSSFTAWHGTLKDLFPSTESLRVCYYYYCDYYHYHCPCCTVYCTAKQPPEKPESPHHPAMSTSDHHAKTAAPAASQCLMSFTRCDMKQSACQRKKRFLLGAHCRVVLLQQSVTHPSIFNTCFCMSSGSQGSAGATVTGWKQRDTLGRLTSPRWAT